MFCVSPCILQRTGFVACECHDDLTASHHPFCYIFHHLACLEKKKSVLTNYLENKEYKTLIILLHL